MIGTKKPEAGTDVYRPLDEAAMERELDRAEADSQSNREAG
jgi:hypothetical protein